MFLIGYTLSSRVRARSSLVQPAADPRDVTGAVKGPEACEQYLTEPIAKHYAIKDRNVPDYRKDIHEKGIHYPFIKTFASVSSVCWLWYFRKWKE